ncbi:acyl-CoA reductase-like NAD-dependent aldehyde dehydrogenase [Micromonospora olivasterospora]|uniref:Acyl-CoA reductase-like NAD-dependent aldehyde dehydrogenase n=1 Tax=Micromonospora olivasterospora TaxID=1880 RepID=A0A562II87_MICOL|nr:acyl-CoA reductase-like NAD-dependent aldehyde dehydrogenase [Micromonospora olivasterospora]
MIAGRINGRPVGGDSRALHGPTGDLVAHLSLSDVPDVDAAVRAAVDAQRAWRRTPPPRRGEILTRAAAILAERRTEFAAAITREEGKTLREAGAEVDRTVDYLSFFGAEGWRLAGHEFANLEPNLRITSRREPLGVVGLITPWNFPLAIPAWKLGPALVAGNSVVLKPALEAPGPSVLLAELLESAGLPPGVLNVLIGGGATVGAAVVAHPGVQAVSFTGSTEIGRQIAAVAGQRMARVQLELGGSNATVVLDDAEPDVAAELIARSAFGLTGQACTATSRVYCTPGIAPALVESLAARARALRIGDGTEPATDVGPLVNPAAHARVAKIVEAAVREGAVLHTPREAPRRSSNPRSSPTSRPARRSSRRRCSARCRGRRGLLAGGGHRLRQRQPVRARRQHPDRLAGRGADLHRRGPGRHHQGERADNRKPAQRAVRRPEGFLQRGVQGTGIGRPGLLHRVQVGLPSLVQLSAAPAARRPGPGGRFDVRRENRRRDRRGQPVPPPSIGRPPRTSRWPVRAIQR